jgi:hypothetical protein
MKLTNALILKVVCIFFLGIVIGCGSGGSGDAGESQQTSQTELISFADDWPEAGTADPLCTVPEDAQPVDTSLADTVVGDGTPESCTSQAFVEAVAAGGEITFDCGPDPVTITHIDSTIE